MDNSASHTRERKEPLIADIPGQDFIGKLMLSVGLHMKKVLPAMSVILILNGSAHSQMREKGSKRDQQTDEQKNKKAEQLKSAEELNKAYKAALDKIPDKKENHNSWGKIR